MNPFLAIRQRMNLPVSAFAHLTQCAPATICAAESGLSERPRKLLRALERLGHDQESLWERYVAWKQAQ